MSSPHAPGGHNAPPLPPADALIPGHNPWGEGHVHTFKPHADPSVTFNPFLGSERGILGRVSVSQHNEIQARADAQDQYRQPGHEFFALPIALGRRAIQGETGNGQELGIGRRAAAAIGAIVLSPAALGYPITLAFRAATNANRGHKKLLKRVIPLEGEAPHEFRDGRAPDPYQIGHAAEPTGFEAAEAADTPIAPPPTPPPRIPRAEGTTPQNPDTDTSHTTPPTPQPESEPERELSEAERRYPDPEPVVYAPHAADYDGPYGDELRRQDQQDERRMNRERWDLVRSLRRSFEAAQATREREGNTPQEEEPVQPPVEHVQAQTDEELMTNLAEAERQVRALPDLSDESLATLPRIVDPETYNDIITVEGIRRAREEGRNLEELRQQQDDDN